MDKINEHLRSIHAKISFIILTLALFWSCNSIKRVPDDKYLLIKNEINVDGKRERSEEINNLLYQQPNSNILGYKLRLNMYNIAKKNPDSSYRAKFLNNPKKLERQTRLLSAKQVQRKGQSFLNSGIHKFLKKTGEAPVILDTFRSEKSLLRIKSHYFNNGFFNADAKFSVDSVKYKKAKVKYEITRGSASIIDSISRYIATPELDSLFEKSKHLSHIKSAERFKAVNFDAERERITTNFRNSGVYYFQQSDITYDIDTIGLKDKVNVKLVVENQNIRQGDSTFSTPFKIYTISEVNIFTDVPTDKSQVYPSDSVKYNGFNLYSYNKLKYKPKAITDAIFITPGNKFADFRTTLTRRYLSNLKVFNSPSIQYKVDERDSTGNSMIANIILVPRKKFSFGASLDLTHSNIQDFGISATTSVSIRNVFNGAETFDIALRGNIGSSKDFANPDDKFFNVSEIGVDTKLSFPRILMPFNTEKIIPKNMIPSTNISLGFAKQKNIGLDKENFTGAMTYNWNPRRLINMRWDLFNVQYVNNVNVGNYFNVYSSSYRALNKIAKENDYISEEENLTIPEGSNEFINDVLKNQTTISNTSEDYRTVRSIKERRDRLSENNFILASSFSFSKTTRASTTDHSFYVLRAKAESAGNLLSLFATTANKLDTENNKKTIFDLEYSQYFKTEFEYIKHWDLSREKVLAIRNFIGIAIPYGNSTNIPFSRSYFAGGSNDIRAWQPYSLGPGSSGAINDFNEANLKFTSSIELRFKMVNSLKGAIFIDAGNIWNAFDDVTDPASQFDNLNSLKDIAVGSGFGFRYDLNFFIIRLDLGFKTYNPSETGGKRWFKDYNFGNSVLNIGINYPF